MNSGKDSAQKEGSHTPREEKGRGRLLGFIIYSIIEEMIIGVVGVLVILIFLPQWLLLGVSCLGVALVLFTAVKIYLYSSSSRVPVEDFLINRIATALVDFHRISSGKWEGVVRVQGETWRAVADSKVTQGAKLRVTGVEELRLHVVIHDA